MIGVPQKMFANWQKKRKGCWLVMPYTSQFIFTKPESECVHPAAVVMTVATTTAVSALVVLFIEAYPSEVGWVQQLVCLTGGRVCGFGGFVASCVT